MSRIIFGLDFGTTNSALAVNSGDKVEIVDVDKFNSSGKTMRSALFFDDESRKVYAGYEAIARYIEDVESGRFMQSIKTFLPDDSFESTEIYRKFYRIEDLISIILEKIKKNGEEYVGETVDSVVLGRPAVFSENKEWDSLAENRLRLSAEKAGFKEIYFQPEPIAAALAFESTLLPGEKKTVFVGDFGGGTSDFTVINLCGGKSQKGMNRKEDILSVGGVYIGGDTFDSSIMLKKVAQYFGRDVKVKYIMSENWMSMSPVIINKLSHWHLIPQLRDHRTRESIRQLKSIADDRKPIENLEELIDDNYGFLLFQAIEKAKCELSSQDETKVFFNDFGITIKENVSRSEFEQMISADTEKIQKCVQEVLSNGSIKSDDIDVVFLTGGSSNIPYIKKVFENMFGAHKVRRTDVFTSVAYGLGISALAYL